MLLIVTLKHILKVNKVAQGKKKFDEIDYIAQKMADFH